MGGALGLAIMATVATTIATNHRGQHAPGGGGAHRRLRAAFVIAGAGLVVGALLALALPKLPAATASHPVAALEEVLEEAGEPQVAFEG